MLRRSHRTPGKRNSFGEKMNKLLTGGVQVSIKAGRGEEKGKQLYGLPQAS